MQYSGVFGAPAFGARTYLVRAFHFYDMIPPSEAPEKPVNPRHYRFGTLVAFVVGSSLTKVKTLYRLTSGGYLLC